jgi:hypothetical protein
MQQNFNALFPDFTDQSRLWMYLSDRPFSNDEVSSIAQELNKFMLSWSAHNKKLKSSGGILFNQMLLVVVDEDFEHASGCSIDSSVRFVKEMGVKYKVDFFNRMFVLALDGNTPSRKPYASAEKDSFINPTLTTLGELRTFLNTSIK